jgi:hypothetical protein
MSRRWAGALTAAAALAMVVGSLTVPSVPARAAPLAITATPLPLNLQAPKETTVGALVYRGGLVLTSDNPDFGGLSGLRVAADGRVVAVTDAGQWVHFRLVEAAGQLTGVRDGQIQPILGFDGEAGDKPDRDVEAVETTVPGSVVISFERNHRLWTYRADDPFDPATIAQRPSEQVQAPAMRVWPLNGGPEAITALPDGRWLILSEEAEGPIGSTQGLLCGEVGAAPATPDCATVLRFGYRAPAGFKPTDAVMLSSTQVLVLNRRFHPLVGMAAAITLIDLAGVTADTVVEGETLARLVPPVSVDNMEGISLVVREGRRMIYLLSDDNFNGLQRTLLMAFEWPQP